MAVDCYKNYSSIFSEQLENFNLKIAIIFYLTNYSRCNLIIVSISHAALKTIHHVSLKNWNMIFKLMANHRQLKVAWHIKKIRVLLLRKQHDALAPNSHLFYIKRQAKFT